MRHTVSVIALALLLASCGGKEERKKDCIDPKTYANICVEQALREEEAKTSSYLDMKYGAEDKAKEIALAPAPVAPGPIVAGPVVAAAPVQQANPAPRNHSSFIFLPVFLPSSQPAAPSFSYSRPAPPRPVQAPSGPSFVSRGLASVARLGTALPAPVKRFLPARPAPTIARPVVPSRPVVPATVPAKPVVRQIPIVPQAPKPVVTPPTVAPKPAWTPPKVTASPPRPSVPVTRSFGRR